VVLFGGFVMLTIETIKAKAIPILKTYGVKRAYLFGSFARGEQNQNSDIDILIEYAPDAERTLFKAVELKYELEDTLQRKVDVLTEAAISPYIRPYILNDMKVIM
jgi:hypothetical protein